MTAEQRNAQPRVLVNQNFQDMSLLGEAIQWNLEFQQIEAGSLDARAVLLAGSESQVMRVEFNRKFHQRGCPPIGVVTFGFPDPNAGPLRWNGSEAQAGALFNFNDGRLDGINRSKFGGYTVSFTEALLHQVAALLQIDIDLASGLGSTPFWNPQGAEHERLRSNLQLFERAGVAGDNPVLRDFKEAFDFDLAASVVRIIGSDHSHHYSETAPFRAAALKRALKILDDPDQIPMRVTELCQEAGTSLATLERAFLEEFGVTPKSYMQSRRLSAVRQELMNAESDALIADIANRWEFWHMGRFAGEYRKQFAELPSQTLRSRHRRHRRLGSTAPILSFSRN
jgi:AraC-like DNA-binding protein